ncbi:hypothetical protein ACKKBG_A13190 [Auxenochlorella protothecoides x Auxenochlorella symbiontica]
MPEIAPASDSPAQSRTQVGDEQPLLDAERQAPVEETAGAKPGVASSLSSWWRRVLRREEVSPSVPAPVPEGGPPSSSDTAPATLTVVEEQCSSSTGDIARLSVSRPGGERSKGDKGVHRTGSQGSMGRRSDPVCLICLETLTSEEFRNGEAMTLDCQCRGDLALRHRECAIKWAQVKGDCICELCKHEVKNLPALPPRPPQEEGNAGMEDVYSSQQMVELAPSHADLVFDCVRVTWVAMIVSILFFDMNLASALWTGLVAGLAYSFMVRLMYRQHFAAMQRLAEAHAAGAGSLARGPVHIPIVTVV